MRQPAARTDPAGLIGRRVVVRHRLHGEQFGATDVLGTLESSSPTSLRVFPDRGGDVVEITLADVIAIKAIPPRTVTRRDVRALESAAVAGWQAPDTAWLGAWLLRAAGGFTGRANSCMPLDDPGMPMSEAVERVRRWYEERDLTPAFQVPEPLGHILGPHLDAQGWPAPENRTIVMTAPIDTLRDSQRRLPTVRVDGRPDAAWLEGYHYRGHALPDSAMDVLINAETVGFASVDEQDARVAIARGAVSDSPNGRRWLGLTAIEVAPFARRRGLGSHIVAGLADWAAAHGAHEAYLQVPEANTAAQATYGQLGFVEHHAYHYRRLV